MGRSTGEYYKWPADNTVIRNEGESIVITTRKGDSYVEARIARDYQRVGGGAAKDAIKILTNVSDPTDYDSAVAAVQAAINA